MENVLNAIEGKVCLVTGGTRGIGRAIAKMLLSQGASVAICGRRQDSVDAAVRSLASETPGKVDGKAADVRNYEEVGQLFQFMDSRFGGIDVLVNNAGVGLFRSVSDISIEEWKNTIETNLSGAFYCSREALFRFGTRGSGYIVNISSLAGKNAFAGGAAYNASKFALTGFTEAMMLDKRNDDVRVSYIMPGSVATEFSLSSAQHGVVGGLSEDWKIWPEDIAEIVRTLLQMPKRTLISRVEVRPSKPKR
ncbi:MAG TPA: SDR family oxidoreductase [Bryobacteraceae bacterium]|nr:SDR family oxidoreductase [Bryobacteraceae bacterium]